MQFLTLAPDPLEWAYRCSMGEEMTAVLRPRRQSVTGRGNP